jgi:hypothetical protein
MILMLNIRKKVYQGLVAAALSGMILTGCTTATTTPTSVTAGTSGTAATTTTGQGTSASTVSYTGNIAVEFGTNDSDDTYDAATATAIKLEGTSASVTGQGAAAASGKVTISAAGTYILSGSFEGQVLVEAGDEDIVRLVLDGADLVNESGAVINVVSADKVVLILADGTENSVTDGAGYSFSGTDTEPDAAIFSKDDLTINGTGSLTVSANYSHGIVSKDDLKIASGNITITSVGDGLKGSDSVAVKSGTVTINAGGDGIQATNDTEADKGYVWIESGIIDITAEQDGIQAVSAVIVKNGTIDVTTGGGSGNASTNASWGTWGKSGTASTSDSSDSAKGLKAGADVTIDGGTITIDSSDDSIHSNDSVTVNGGSISMSSGDDGIHGDTAVTLNGGDINIVKAYEGIESSKITVNDGNVSLTTSDDGFNAAGGADGSSLNNRPGQNSFSSTSGVALVINGGNVYVNASGDGLDSNGNLEMNGGTVIVSGPTSNNNGALDYNGEFSLNGGFLIAAGSSGMAESPGTGSAQNSAAVFLTSQTAGTLVRVEDPDGNVIAAFEPAKAYSSVVISSSELVKGDEYTVILGGTATGTETDGYYSDGTFSGGTEAVSFTVSGAVTQASQSGAQTGGMGGQGGGRK